MAVILIEKRERNAIVTLNRPESFNAMNYQAWKEITEAWIDLKNDPEVWTIILTATGDKAFCAGQDLKEMARLKAEAEKEGRPFCVSFARGNAHEVSGDAQARDCGDQWFCHWRGIGVGLSL